MNKAIPKSFTTFTGKHLRYSFFFNEVAAKNTFFIEHLRWLLLQESTFPFICGGYILKFNPNFLWLLFCYHKKYQCNHLKNKCSHIKHTIFSSSAYAICNIILTSSLKNCTGTGVDQTIRERQTENWLKAKYKAEALQKEFLKSEIKLLCSVYF